MASHVLGPSTILRVQSWNALEQVPLQLEQTLGVRWPSTTGSVARGHAEIVCVGPADCLVIASHPDPRALLQPLAAAFQGSAFRLTNVSCALARIRIEGSSVRDLLSKACALDFDPQAFPLDRSARSRFAGMPVVVRCVKPNCFECIVSLSYADHLNSWLADAALEFA